jgi:hypothetical protein
MRPASCLLLRFSAEFNPEPAFTAAVDEPAPSKTDSAAAWQEARTGKTLIARAKIISNKASLPITVTSSLHAFWRSSLDSSLNVTPAAVAELSASL